MKFFAFLLLINLINLSVNGQEETCRQWKEDKSTDLTKLFGHWFTYLEDKYLVEKNDLCSEYTFTWNKTDQSVNLVNDQHKEDKSITVIKGSGYKTPYPGVFDVVYENGLIFGISAVAMNTDYILFGGCFNQKDYIRIVTRERNPSEETKKIIEAKIEEHDVDRTKLILS